MHADQHSITFRLNSSDTVFFTNDGGVFSTYNATSSNIIFSEKNNSLNTLQFYSCDLNPDSAGVGFIGGLQDNGTILYTGSPITYYSSVSGGDGAYCFFDDDDYIISTVYYNSIYIRKKNNSNYQLYNAIDDYYGTGTFICPTGYDQNNKTFYANAVTFTNANSNQLLRIKNITSLSYTAQLITLSTNSNVPFSCVHVSKFSTSTNTILYVGNQTGKLFKVINAQLSPGTASIGSNSFPTANISCIAEGETSDELLVTFSNYGVSSVWYTNNGGSSWIEIEGNLPDMPVRWALFDPENKNSVLLATEVGIWATENIHDASVSWTPVVNGLANVRVDMLRLRKTDNTILAATHGRGLYYCDLEGGISTSISDIDISENKIFQIYPVPVKENLKIKFNQDINEPINIAIYNEAGVIVKSMQQNKVVKDQVVDLNLANNKTGFYIININYGNKKYSKKILIEK